MQKWCLSPSLILVDHLDPPLVAEYELEADPVEVDAVPDRAALRDPDVRGDDCGPAEPVGDLQRAQLSNDLSRKMGFNLPGRGRASRRGRRSTRLPLPRLTGG